MTANTIEDPEGVADTVERFGERYGADRVADFYPKQDAAVEVQFS